MDKYSDVLDSEVAELDFTEVYMRSLSRPTNVEDALYPIESEMKQQLSNVQKYRDVIREEKDLTELVGKETGFDLDSALRRVLTYFDQWKGNAAEPIENIGINDEKIIRHLNQDIVTEFPQSCPFK